MTTAALKTRAQKATAPVPFVPSCPVEAYAREAADLARKILARPKSHRLLDDEGRCKASPLYDRLGDIQTDARDTAATSEVGAAYQAILLFQRGGLLGTEADPEGLSARQRSRISEHDDYNRRTALSILNLLLRRLNDADLFLLFMWSDLATNTPAKPRAAFASFEGYVKRLWRPRFAELAEGAR